MFSQFYIHYEWLFVETDGAQHTKPGQCNLFVFVFTNTAFCPTYLPYETSLFLLQSTNNRSESVVNFRVPTEKFLFTTVITLKKG